MKTLELVELISPKSPGLIFKDVYYKKTVKAKDGSSFKQHKQLQVVSFRENEKGST